MILVDTSIWIDHLRKTDAGLQDLLLEARVTCHPYVAGDLACVNLRNRAEILSLLRSLPEVPTITSDEFHFFVEEHRLMGSGLGFVDVHLLGAAHLSGLRLWTDDRQLRSAATKLGVCW